jgi:hypothetical protein
MMCRLTGLLFAALVLTCCETKPRGSINAYYANYIGRSIGDFVTETGETPTSHFDNDKGERIFMFAGPIPNKACRVIKTEPDGKNYRITEIHPMCS